MTNADQLRAWLKSKSLEAPYELLHEIADTLDRNQDTIAQLRAERDALARERDRMREALEHCLECSAEPEKYGRYLSKQDREIIRDALKGETSA